MHVATTTTTAMMALALTATTAMAALASSSSQGLSLQLHRVAEPIHSETYRRRRLQNVDGTFESVPLNPGLGTHYAWVYAGTPPQRASVITDTGSSLMAIPCSGCTGCGTHTDEPFDTLNSSTLTHVTCANAAPVFKCKGCSAERSDMCAISQAYMEGSSWDATVVEDIVYLGSANSSLNAHMRQQFGTHFMFGCQKKETGLFITQVADGIMGLSNNDDNLVAKLFAEQKIPQKLFALCFADGGGAMSIGVLDTARHRGDVEYAKLGPDPLHTDFYNVALRDVRIGNVSINATAKSFSTGHFIVDSGTTDSYLPTSMKPAFEKAFELVTGLPYQTSGANCVGFTAEQVAALPNLQVVLVREDGSDLVLQVPPDQYLIAEKHGYCANVFLSEFSGGVLGANIMMNRDVVFDRENKRVGFVDADCTYRQLDAVDSEVRTPSPSPTLRDTPAPGVVATSETAATNATAPANTTTTNVTTLVPTVTTSAPTMTPVATTQAPTPTPTPTPTQTQAPTQAPTQTPTRAPTQTPTQAPTTQTPKPTTDATVTLNAENATPVPTATASTSTTHTNHEAPDEHPMVLTVVGTVLVLVFLLVVAASIKFNRGKKDQSWSRVKENEDDDDDDDDDDSRPSSPLGSKNKKKKQPLRSDEVGSDDDDDDDDNVGSDDDDDEIFDRAAHDHEATKHDTRVLERL